MINSILYSVLMFMAAFSAACALECYVCNDASHNRINSECRQNRERCDQFQDACVAYTRWAVQDVTSARGERRYYISKGCDTRQGCERRLAQTSSVCHRDYYNDWACVECCSGDLCNYYVTEGSSMIQANFVMTFITIATAVFTKACLL